MSSNLFGARAGTGRDCPRNAVGPAEPVIVSILENTAFPPFFGFYSVWETEGYTVAKFGKQTIKERPAKSADKLMIFRHFIRSGREGGAVAGSVLPLVSHRFILADSE